MTAALPPSQNDRREHLRRYLMACLGDNLLSPADLMSPMRVLERLRATLADDLKYLGRDIVARTALGVVDAVWRGR